MSGLTHLDAAGAARMVDVSDKAVTTRTATATGRITMSAAALDAIVRATLAKGDALAVARIAGIAAAKRTADLIPLCHPLPLTAVEVALEPEGEAIRCTATVRTTGRTGVEMEALTAVTVALLALYDMVKSVDRGMAIEGVTLLHKAGGRSGEWRAEG